MHTKLSRRNVKNAKQTRKPRIINLYAGPGTGKSTTAAALFAELKYRGVNCELVTEYAKDAAWEKRSKKFFEAQEYIFGKQSWRISRVATEVDVVITDSPIVMGLVYRPKGYLPGLKRLIMQTYAKYDNLDVFLRRNKPFNPKGRNQTEDESKDLDRKILELLEKRGLDYTTLDFGRQNVEEICGIMDRIGWEDLTVHK